MAEKFMTPMERAERVMRGWWPSMREEHHKQLTLEISKAIAAAVREREDMLATEVAEQAKLASDAQRKADDYRDILVSRGGGEVHELLSELDAAKERGDAEKQRADEAIARADATGRRMLDIAQHPVVITLIGEKHAALAREAALRKAITEYRHWFDTCTKTLAEDWQDKAAAAIDDLDAALAAPSPGLDAVRREAQIEAANVLEVEASNALKRCRTLNTSAARHREMNEPEAAANEERVANIYAELGGELAARALDLRKGRMAVKTTKQLGPELSVEQLLPLFATARRAGAIEALEGLPCEYTRMTNYTCLRPAMVPSLPNDPKCDRCRALAALKGGAE